MATQGLLTITHKGKTKCKVVTGSDGYNIPELAKWIRTHRAYTNEQLWSKAKTLFGVDSLVMQIAADKALYDGAFEHPKLNGDCLYFTKFEQPLFNPRWKLGTADYSEVIEVE